MRAAFDAYVAAIAPFGVVESLLLCVDGKGKRAYVVNVLREPTTDETFDQMNGPATAFEIAARPYVWLAVSDVAIEHVDAAVTEMRAKGVTVERFPL